MAPKKTISSMGWLYAGIGFAAAATMQIALFLQKVLSFYPRGNAFGMFVVLAGYVVALLAFFLRKRNILLPISFALMTLGFLIDFIKPFTADKLFLLVACAAMCAMTASLFTSFIPGRVRDAIAGYSRLFWYAPAALLALGFILRLLVGVKWDAGIHYNGYSMMYIQHAFMVGPAMAFGAMWIMFPNETPRFDLSWISGGVKTPPPAVYDAPVEEVPAAPTYEAPAPSAPVYDAPAPEAPAYDAPAPEAPMYDEPAPEAPAEPEVPVLTTNGADPASQLKVYQELLTDGIITPEEYERKRREILGK